MSSRMVALAKSIMYAVLIPWITSFSDSDRCMTFDAKRYIPCLSGYYGITKLMSKNIARKLIRLSGRVTREDIDNEAKAIGALCGPGTSKYIVEVMRHGWLPRNPSYYYID